MTFLFDENISPGVVESLKPLEMPVVHITQVEELGRGAMDEFIFEFLRRRPDWFLVTQDKQMRHKKHQCRAMLEAGLGVFILTGRAVKTNHKMVLLLLQCWDEIEKNAGRTSRPFIFGISDLRVFKRLDIEWSYVEVTNSLWCRDPSMYAQYSAGLKHVVRQRLLGPLCYDLATQGVIFSTRLRAKRVPIARVPVYFETRTKLWLNSR